MEFRRADSADRVARGPGGAVVSELSWSDLVDAATLGLTRRPLRSTELGGVAGRHSGGLEGQDPAGTELDGAAAGSDRAGGSGGEAQRGAGRPGPGWDGAGRGGAGVSGAAGRGAGRGGGAGAGGG